MTSAPPLRGHAHVAAAMDALRELDAAVPMLEFWGEEFAARLQSGSRLLAAGNGGSAAHAQHLTAELVGRYCLDRAPFSAIALHADTSTVTALVNDYPPDELFARQVRAHGREGDVLFLSSTSGTSPNLLLAVEAAHAVGITTYAMTGRGPNPLCDASAHALAIDASAPTAQEMHQIAIHVICAAFDAAVERSAFAAR